ncbi:uncharacterized protein EI97DRAFT_366855 [Westerdykella ornata]|uniref:Sorting nexin-4 n=1 Tax=Westerdykella ornata TaxID=318751 RepID=A0A6A6JYF4_WESOR|nr:uncharacterized protein EI97DRAFT_366855 [Westerdykella ornata]KAF2281254.1 hypothetical protein EI97DRAFT_366855 [Westerdykella ornata]
MAEEDAKHGRLRPSDADVTRELTSPASAASPQEDPPLSPDAQAPDDWDHFGDPVVNRKDYKGKGKAPLRPTISHTTTGTSMAADFSEGRLETTVGSPQKELAGTKDAYVSYLVTTKSDFQSFQRPEFSVRRRFTDFVFLWKQLSKEFPQCAIPPLPDKHKLEYVRGDRFGPDFTQRRAHSLHRFLKRMTLHPVLRRAALLIIFLETPDWNQQMRGRTSRGASLSDSPSAAGGTSGGIVDSFTESLLNTFTKPHKPDKRFIEVNERAAKLADDLSNVEKVTQRVVRREHDLEDDYTDLAVQCQKLISLEPGVESTLTSFASSVATTSQGLKALKEHTDQDYLTSLRDMDAYIQAVKSLLKTRENKQLDFEALTDYLARTATERDALASAAPGTSGLGASGFLRSKVEDLRGIDHEQSRRQRLRKLEVEIERLTNEVEQAKKTSEAFDEHTVKEVKDFERIKALEFRDTLGALAERNVEFFKRTVETWEGFLEGLEREEEERRRERENERQVQVTGSGGERSEGGEVVA